MKKTKTIILCVLLCFLILLVFFLYKKSANDAVQKNRQELYLLTQIIKKKVQVIDSEKNYQTKTLNNEQFLGHMTDGGGQLIGYYKDGKIYKIEESLGLSYGVKKYRYYFDNLQLILVNEKEEVFPDTDNTGTLDYTKVEPTFQAYYYFDKGKMINYESTGQKNILITI